MSFYAGTPAENRLPRSRFCSVDGQDPATVFVTPGEEVQEIFQGMDILSAKNFRHFWAYTLNKLHRLSQFFHVGPDLIFFHDFEYFSHIHRPRSLANIKNHRNDQFDI